MSDNTYLMLFYVIHICQIKIFKFYIIYNKYEMIKIVNQTRKKSQVLLQVLE